MNQAIRIRSSDGIEETYRPEPDLKFSAPENIQEYVDTVLGHLRDRGSDFGGREKLDITIRAREGNRYAHYERTDAAIAIPPRTIGGSWALRAIVVLHEIAHHLADDDLHGPEFQHTFIRLLEAVGLRVTAEMLYVAFGIEGLNESLVDDDRSLSRIAKLLRQAERTTNEAERDTFMEKAQSLATRHSIALAVARARITKEERREQPSWEHVTIGDRGSRYLVRYVRLMIEVAESNDVRIAVAHGSHRVTLYGFPSDIAVAKALYASLLTQMVADGDAYIRSGLYRLEIVRKWSQRRGKWEDKPVHGSTARTAFYESWAFQIGQRLASARKKATAAAISTGLDADSREKQSTSTELAILAKNVEIVDYYAAMQSEHDIKGTWKGDRKRASDEAPHASSAGRNAANKARLGNEKAIG